MLMVEGRLANCLAAVHAREMSEMKEALRRHPNRDAVDRLLEALDDSFECMQRLIEIEDSDAVNEEQLRELDLLHYNAVNAHMRMKAAADELEADVRWLSENGHPIQRFH